MAIYSSPQHLAIKTRLPAFFTGALLFARLSVPPFFGLQGRVAVLVVVLIRFPNGWGDHARLGADA